MQIPQLDQNALVKACDTSTSRPLEVRDELLLAHGENRRLHSKIRRHPRSHRYVLGRGVRGAREPWIVTVRRFPSIAGAGEASANAVMTMLSTGLDGAGERMRVERDSSRSYNAWR